MAGARIPQKKPVERRISLVFASVCRRVFLPGCAAASLALGRCGRKIASSRSPRQPRPSNPACSIISCRSSPRRAGSTVRVVAVGTGQALAIGARGDADALLVHDRVGEDKFVADGNGIDRREVMFNDFVLVGPRAIRRAVRGLKDAKEAFGRSPRPRRPSPRAATTAAPTAWSCALESSPCRSKNRRQRPGIASSAPAWARR